MIRIKFEPNKEPKLNIPSGTSILIFNELKILKTMGNIYYIDIEGKDLIEVSNYLSSITNYIFKLGNTYELIPHSTFLTTFTQLEN